MRKPFSLITLISLFLTAPMVSGSDISNFFTPFGFRTPLLERGQYVLNFNPGYYRYEFQQNPTRDFLVESKWTRSRYGFSLNGLYAITGKVVVGANLILYPGQKRWEDLEVFYDVYMNRMEIEVREHSHFTASPGLQLSFRPRTSIQLYGDFRSSREKSYLEYRHEERIYDSRRDDMGVNFGLTLLGEVRPERYALGSNQEILGFLKPYGLRAPLLDQGQYAANLDFLYERTETSLDYAGSSSTPHEWVWRRYYLSLSGLYAVTEKLIFQADLYFYPAQTRETREREKMGTIGSYGEMRCDFAVFPRLVVALRPKSNMEFSGVFLYRKENLHKGISPISHSDLTNVSYSADLGYTILLKHSPRGSGPIPEAEFSDFFTPYRFSTPLLRKGQCALNANLHHSGAESEEHFDPGSSAGDNRFTLRVYRFSLGGVYALIDDLVLECGLDIFPGQTRVTRRLGRPSHQYWYYYVGGQESEERYHFTISPRLEVSFRPRAGMEFYGSFRFNEEKAWLEDRDGQRANDLKNESLYLEFGLTVLSGL